MIRANGQPWNPNPGNAGTYTNLNSDPRAKISYNPLTNTVTLDYSALPQTEMPTDDYAIVVESATTTSPGVTGTRSLLPTVSPAPVTAQVSTTSLDT